MTLMRPNRIIFVTCKKKVELTIDYKKFPSQCHVMPIYSTNTSLDLQY